ncbi:hypothetical protein [Prochlorothrix hollandica]|uniref:Uncharacterized protein n=1 Tax=Prochlorothrix hollandica PCC 9006 = CALU 1027 TaxID=317619 RepID=A0A0M2PT31_PROHO|nr:hypothetical protein [Prochlorothrix hollandica]KKI99294.1 hypothetical protein PROH_16345 [Prochlorothrix hollandica PCC 9006 = CALU 1027]
MNLPFLRWINTILMLNFFFVLASCLWFLAAVGGRMVQVPLGLDLWYGLWQPLFQPAIGLLMAGALVSGVGGWLGQRWQQWRSPQ